MKYLKIGKMEWLNGGMVEFREFDKSKLE